MPSNEGKCLMAGQQLDLGFSEWTSNVPNFALLSTHPHLMTQL